MGTKFSTTPLAGYTNTKFPALSDETAKGHVTPAGMRAAINVEDGADVTDATNVEAAGAAMAANDLSDLNDAATARTNLGLGSAATTATTAYATAAQGTKADDALPSADLAAALSAHDLVMLGRATSFRISSGEFTTSPAGTVKNTGQSATYRMDTGTGVSRRVVRGIDLLIADGSSGKLNFSDQFAIIFKGGYRSGTTGTGNFLACGVSTTGYSATPKTGNGMWLDLRDLDIYAAQNGAAADTTINTAIGNVSTYILQNNGDGTGSLTVDGTLAHTYSGLPTSGEVIAFVDAYNSDTSARCAGVFDDNVWVITGPF